MIIEISKLDILEHFISSAEECSVSEARQILNSADVEIDVTETGCHDKGDWKQELDKITITYEK